MDHAPLLAHGGGWDEILIVFGPVLLIFVLLRLVDRRATRHRGGEPRDGAAPGSSPPEDER